jgi:hypothetical protein
MQAMLHENVEFTRGLDRLVRADVASEVMLVRRCHAWVGRAARMWLEREPAALSKHVSVIREAAKLEMHMVDMIKPHTSHQLKVL